MIQLIADSVTTNPKRMSIERRLRLIFAGSSSLVPQSAYRGSSQQRHWTEMIG